MYGPQGQAGSSRAGSHTQGLSSRTPQTHLLHQAMVPDSVPVRPAQDLALHLQTHPGTPPAEAVPRPPHPRKAHPGCWESSDGQEHIHDTQTATGDPQA